MEDFISTALSLDTTQSSDSEDDQESDSFGSGSVEEPVGLFVKKRLSGLGPRQTLFMQGSSDSIDEQEAKKNVIPLTEGTKPVAPLSEDTLVELNMLILSFPDIPRGLPSRGEQPASVSSVAVQSIAENFNKTLSSAAASGASLFSSFKGFLSNKI